MNCCGPNCRACESSWLNGEVVPVSLLKLALDILPGSVRVFNTYSISETHDVCTIDLTDDLTDLCLDGMDTCPVGLPMEGVKVRVRPQGQFDLASSGVGELFVGGRSLARGYLKRPDLDSESFVSWKGERYYATGDLAEVGTGGMTKIIGRTDSMVKIRGYSVYLGAIEETLRKHCDVSDAAVLAGNRRRNRQTARGPRCPGPAGNLEGRRQERDKQGPADSAGAAIYPSTRCPVISWNW